MQNQPAGMSWRSAGTLSLMGNAIRDSLIGDERSTKVRGDFLLDEHFFITPAISACINVAGPLIVFPRIPGERAA